MSGESDPIHHTETACQVDQRSALRPVPTDHQPNRRGKKRQFSKGSNQPLNVLFSPERRKRADHTLAILPITEGLSLIRNSIEASGIDAVGDVNHAARIEPPLSASNFRQIA